MYCNFSTKIQTFEKYMIQQINVILDLKIQIRMERRRKKNLSLAGFEPPIFCLVGESVDHCTKLSLVGNEATLAKINLKVKLEVD